jgi:hypothetical protein
MMITVLRCYFLENLYALALAMYAWAAYSRKSFGMLANYLLLATIDSVGLLRMF